MWRALVLLCLYALPVPRMAAQTPGNTPAPLLMPESRLPAKLSVPVFGQNIAFYDVGSGPVVVLVLQGDNAIKKNRELMGATDPAKAEAGTIRKAHGANIEFNAVHGSDSSETANFEIGYFFPEMDLVG